MRTIPGRGGGLRCGFGLVFQATQQMLCPQTINSIKADRADWDDQNQTSSVEELLNSAAEFFI